MPNYDFDKNQELADWIRAIGRWKTRQRRLKSVIKEIESLLREREELVEEALWMRATAKSHEEYQEADEALSKAVAMAQSKHESTVRALEQICEDLQDSHVSELFERPSMASPTREVEDLVDEASKESFPASDPPSFNPGHS